MKNQTFESVLPLLLGAGLMGAAATNSPAAVQSSSEVWVGSSSRIQGNGGTGSKISMFAQRMVLPIETAGVVNALANVALIDTNSTWADSQYGSNGVPAYVEFDNGWMADIAACSASTHCLTLAGNVSAAVSPGAAYRVHKHFTVATMFGTNNEAGLLAGLNLTTSDNILLEVPQTQQAITIFYYNDGTYHDWLYADYSPAGNQVIYPEQGVMVRRRAGTDVNVYLAGPVKTGATVTTIDPGYNLVGTLKSSTSLTLPQLNLYTGDPTTGIANGWNLTTSDNLVVIHPDGSTQTFFYYKDPTFESWLDASYASANTAQIDPGTAFFIHRKAPNSSFNWTIPAE
jgi:hypothetical protein